MAYSTSGGVDLHPVSGAESGTSVFLLKNADGCAIQQFVVKASEEADFMERMKRDEVSIRSSYGEREPLRLIKISKCF